MNLRLILLLLIFSVSFHSFSQKRIKWVIVQGSVVDTFGYALPNERVALISNRGNDKTIQITDEFGRFSFMIKKKKLKDYAVRCYYSGVRNNQTIALQELIKHGTYVVQTNEYYAHHKQYKFLRRDELLDREAVLGDFTIRCYAYNTPDEDRKFYNFRYKTDLNDIVRSVFGIAP